MSQVLRSIIIEGVDRLGKSSLVQGIQDEFGFFQTMHFQRPSILETYLKEARIELNRAPGVLDDEMKSYALRKYQNDSFANMFRLLNSSGRLILDRAHLGESVYAKRYRSYSGDYVFSMEAVAENASAIDTTLLVLLHTSDFSFIKDDGESFDFSKKEEEQNDFIRAFEKSKIKHKVMVDVSFEGGYAPKEKIARAVTRAYRDLPGQYGQVWYVTWQRDGDNIVSSNHLAPDPSKGIA
jgi:thymidylate kinase